MKMLRFIWKRLLMAVVTLFVLATVSFALMRAAPGDPFTRTKEIPAQTMANLTERYGMDKPLYVQYFRQMKMIFLDFNFGESFRAPGRTVNEYIANQFQNTAQVAIWAVIWSMIVGVVLGILMGKFRNSLFDRVMMVVTVLGNSVPSFVLAFWVQYFVAVYPIQQKWSFAKPGEWFNAAGMNSPKDLILPAFVLGASLTVVVMRFMRNQMIEVSFAEYMKTAKAKGVSELRLLLLHQIRNAIMPVITVASGIFAGVMTGSIFVETIFGIQGLGSAYVIAIQALDYNVLMGMTIFFGGFLIVVNVFTDVLYMIVDPRVKLS